MLVDVRHWFRSLPPVTKFLLAILVAIRIAVIFNLLSYDSLANQPQKIITNGEAWRIFTPFFSHGPIVGGLSSPLVPLLCICVDILFIAYFLPGVEVEMFPSSLDFLAFNLCGALGLLLASIYAPTNWLANGLVMLNLYYWSQRDPNYELTLLFWRLPARFSPYVYVVLRFILGSFPLQQILAAILASVYINLQDSGILPILKKTPGRTDDE